MIESVVFCKLKW